MLQSLRPDVMGEPGHGWSLDRFIAEIDEPTPERPSTLIWTLAVCGVVASVIEIALEPDGVLLSLVASLAAAAAFLVHRTHPTLGLGLLVVPTVTLELADAAFDLPFGFPIAAALLALATIFGLARRAPARLVGALAVLTVIVVPVTWWLRDVGEESPAWIAVDALGNAVVIAIGLAARAIAAERDTRERSERERERNRLANDIHDSVAHHMSAIALRAEAARQFPADEEVAQALDAIKKSASTGLADMRHLVNELRQHAPPSQPLPGLGDIRQLAAETASPSLAVNVDIDANAEIVPVAAASAVYAICREAMTNVQRHAVGASEVTITVRETSRGLDLAVADDGTTPLAPRRSGHGLSSMTQRAEDVGGFLTAGPNPTGGWIVAAQIPTVPSP